MENRQDQLRERLIEALSVLAVQYPAMSASIDLLRPCVVSQPGNQYSDDAVEVWVRLGENVPAFYVESRDRWFQEGIGIVYQNTNHVILSDGYGLQPSDHIILRGEAWMVTESVEQAGVAQVTIDKPKSRYVAPGRLAPVYRQLGMKARIV